MSFRILAALAAVTATVASLPASADVYGGADRDVPLPRFEDRLCPGVAGLKREQAEFVVDRIRENAATLGLPLADPANCRANILLAVFPDGREYIKQLRDRRPYAFKDLDLRQRDQLFDRKGPVRSFLRILTRTRDGLEVEQSDRLDIPSQASMAMAHSKIYVPVRRDIIFATVLVDKAAVADLSLGQLADYATMRALSGESAEAVEMPGGSILSLFDEQGNERPAELTANDRTLLHTLYGTLANNPAAITLSLAQQRIDRQSLAE